MMRFACLALLMLPLTVRADNPVRITRDGSYKQHLQWSPDGKRIAFISTRDGGSDVYLLEMK